MAKKIKKTSKKPPEGKMEKTQEEKIKKMRIRVVGIGGGGGSIVSEIASRIKKASFLAANTDLQALKIINKRVIRFPFGQNLTKGLGTGMNVELAQEAAQNEKEKIKKIFQGQDLCIFIACLGGGTGSGAAPVFGKIAKNLGLITLGIFTLPFKFEGERKMEIAKEALEKLKPHFNALIIIPNERIFQVIDKTTPLKEALSAINKNLAESLESLIKTIYQPGLINIDFADLKTILEGRGRLSYLNAIKIPTGQENIEAIKKVLNSSLYPYSISGAKGLLFNISGEKKLSLAEVSQVSKAISEMVNPEAKIIFGLAPGKKVGSQIKVTLLATGCQTRIFSEKLKIKKTRKKSVSSLSPTPKLKGKSPVLLKEKSPPPSLFKSKDKALARPKTKIKKEEKIKPKKIKIETSRIQTLQTETESKNKTPSLSIEKTEEKIRKNAIQVKKEIEEAEKEFLEKEKFWETPAFLRKRKNRGFSIFLNN